MSNLREALHEVRDAWVSEGERIANATPAERISKARSFRASSIALCALNVCALALGTLPVFFARPFPSSNWVFLPLVLLSLAYSVWGIRRSSKQIRTLSNPIS